MPPADSDQVRPIFVTSGEPQLTPEEQKDRKNGVENPLDEQLNIEIAYFVRYRPNQDHGGIFRLIRNIGGIRGKSAEETKQVIVNLLQEQSERDMKSIITRQTYATVVENWALVNEVFRLSSRERSAARHPGRPSRCGSGRRKPIPRHERSANGSCAGEIPPQPGGHKGRWRRQSHSHDRPQ
jgi:hypothetical protein